MAGEPNTAEKQNEIRRAQKQKQRYGKKKNRGRVEDQEKIKVNRHINAKFGPNTELAIKEHFLNKPEEAVTTEFFRGLMKNQAVDVVGEAPYGDISITEADIECGIGLKTVTVFTAGGYGVKFKVVGGFQGKPRKVIIL